MAGDLHVEALAHADGLVRVYLTDLHRRPLPLAGVTATATLDLRDGKVVLPLSAGDEALEARAAPLAIGDLPMEIDLERDGRVVALHLMVPVGIVPGLAGLPRVCTPPVGPAPRDGSMPRCTVDFPRMVRALAATPDGGTLLVAGFGHGVTLWTLPAGEATGALDPAPGVDPHADHVHGVDALAVRADGREAAVAVEERLLRYVLPAGTRVGELSRDYHVLRTLAYAPDGTRLMTSTLFDGSVEMIGTDDGRELARRRIDRPLTAAAFAADRELAVLASELGPLSVVGLATDGPARVFPASLPVRAIGIAADRLVTAADDGVVTVWSLATGEVVSRTPPAAPVIALAIAPGGGLVASGHHDGTIRLYDLPGGRLVRTLAGHTAPVQALAWAGRGMLASGDSQGRLALWDVGG